MAKNRHFYPILAKKWLKMAIFGEKTRFFAKNGSKNPILGPGGPPQGGSGPPRGAQKWGSKGNTRVFMVRANFPLSFPHIGGGFSTFGKSQNRGKGGGTPPNWARDPPRGAQLGVWTPPGVNFGPLGSFWTPQGPFFDPIPPFWGVRNGQSGGGPEIGFGGPKNCVFGGPKRRFFVDLTLGGSPVHHTSGVDFTEGICGKSILRRGSQSHHTLGSLFEGGPGANRG